MNMQSEQRLTGNPCVGSEPESDRTDCKRWRYYAIMAKAD